MRDLPEKYKFKISVQHNWKWYKYPVYRVDFNKSLEHFELRARNKTLTFQSNRPVLRRKGLNSRSIEWKLIKGECWNVSFLNSLVDEMTNVIIRYERHDPERIKDHPKNN